MDADELESLEDVEAFLDDAVSSWPDGVLERHKTAVKNAHASVKVLLQEHLQGADPEI